MSAPAVVARGLEKRFGPIPALRGVDFEVAAGTLLAVVGPNGAGKTTLLRLVSGLARPSAGTLSVGGESRDRRRMRAKVGLVGHATFLYPELSARENLVFSARLYGIADAEDRADALLADHRLEDWAGRPTRTLSRGLAQRVAIARSLVHDPPILLMDEPFTGLDPRSADRLARHLVSLRERGHAVLLVSHDLARAAEIADVALALDRGRVRLRASGPELSPETLAHAVVGEAG